MAPGNLSKPNARQVALLTSDEGGNQSIVARHVFDKDTVGKDRVFLAGETFGNEVVTDGTGIWEVDGQTVDVMVSAVTKQDSLLVLLDLGHIVEMRGIWGTNGTAMLPSEVITHAPGGVWTGSEQPPVLSRGSGTWTTVPSSTRIPSLQSGRIWGT